MNLSYPNISLRNDSPNTIHSEEKTLFNRNVKIGFLLAGLAISSYAIYNNYVLLLNASQSLLARTVEGGMQLKESILKCVDAVFLGVLHKIRPGLEVILNKLMSEQKLSLITKIWNGYITTENCIAVLKNTSLVFFALLVLKNLVYSILIFCKACVSKDPWRTFMFLYQCPSTWEAINISNATLQNIFASDPWDAFQFFYQSSHIFPNLMKDNKLQHPILKKMFDFSGYPSDISDILLNNSNLWVGNNNQNLLLNKALIWEVLDYLNQYPDLFQGETKLPIPVLKKVLSLTDPISALYFLGENPFLWKGANKLPDDILLTLVTSPQFEPICSELHEWLPFFQGPYALSIADIEKVFNFREDFNEEFAKFFVEKMTIDYLSIQQEAWNLGKNPFPCLNIERFINDTETDKWNMLPRRHRNITNNDWLMLRGNLKNILAIIYPGDKIESDKKANIINWFEICLTTQDAIKTKQGLETIKHRVASVVDYLGGLTALLDTALDEPQMKLLSKKLEAIIDVLDEGGKACPDRAIVALTSAENRIKLFQDPCYISNVLVNMFKLNQIEAKLVNQNQAENLETYLYYTLKFNTILNLSLFTSTMLYEAVAQKQPLGQALSKLVTEFTAENLIGYAANLREFKILFEAEAAIALQKIEQLMNDVCAIPDDMAIEERTRIISDITSLGITLKESEINQIRDYPKTFNSLSLVGTLNNRRVRMEASFYENKAKELFLKSQFLLD